MSDKIHIVVADNHPVLRPVDEAEAPLCAGWSEMFAAEPDDTADFAAWDVAGLSSFDQREWQ